MKLVKLCETKKLHYGEYLYKLVLHNRLNNIFRTVNQKKGSLSYAKEKLDAYTEKLTQGQPLEEIIFRTTREIPVEHFFDAKNLYKILKESKGYKIRVQPWSTITIYSNNKELLLKIADTMKVSAREFWEPDIKSLDLLLGERNIIISETPVDLNYKVTFGKNPVNPDFAKWLRANTDKSKVGTITLETIEAGGYLDGLYFYIRDEKVLNLISMLAGNNIRRIDKLVYKENIDKY